MIAVYVESNFLLELRVQPGRGQGPYEEILGRAERHELELVAPALALVEPQWTLRKRRSDDRQQRSSHRGAFRRIRKNTSLSDIGERLESDLDQLLIMCEEEESRQMQRARDRLLRCGRILALSADHIVEARALVNEVALDWFDALMLAAVLHDLADRDGPSVFLNRNVKDFVVPDILTRLSSRGCHLIGSFADGRARLRSDPDA